MQPKRTHIHLLSDDVIFLIFMKGCQITLRQDLDEGIQREQPKRNNKKAGKPSQRAFCRPVRQVCRRWRDIVDHPFNPRFWISHLSLHLDIAPTESRDKTFQRLTKQFCQSLEASRGCCLSISIRLEIKAAQVHDDRKVTELVKIMDQLPLYQKQIVKLKFYSEFIPLLEAHFRILAQFSSEDLQLNDLNIEHALQDGGAPEDEDGLSQSWDAVVGLSNSLQPLKQLNYLSHVVLTRLPIDLLSTTSLPPTVATIYVQPLFLSSMNPDAPDSGNNPLVPLFTALASYPLLTYLELDFESARFGPGIAEKSHEAWPNITFPKLIQIDMHMEETEVVCYLLLVLRYPKLEHLIVFVYSETGCEAPGRDFLAEFKPRFECLVTFKFSCSTTSEWRLLDWIHSRMRFPRLETLHLSLNHPENGPTIPILPACLDDFKPLNLLLENMEERAVTGLLTELNLSQLESATVKAAKEQPGLAWHQSESHTPSPRVQDLELDIRLSFGILQVFDQLLEPWSVTKLRIDKHVGRDGLMSGWEACMLRDDQAATYLTVNLVDGPELRATNDGELEIVGRFLSLFERVETLDIHLPFGILKHDIWFRALATKLESLTELPMPRLKHLKFLSPAVPKVPLDRIESRCRDAFPLLEDPRRLAGCPLFHLEVEIGSVKGVLETP